MCVLASASRWPQSNEYSILYSDSASIVNFTNSINVVRAYAWSGRNARRWPILFMAMGERVYPCLMHVHIVVVYTKPPCTISRIYLELSQEIPAANMRRNKIELFQRCAGNLVCGVCVCVLVYAQCARCGEMPKTNTNGPMLIHPIWCVNLNGLRFRSALRTEWVSTISIENNSRHCEHYHFTTYIH